MILNILDNILNFLEKSQKYIYLETDTDPDPAK